MLMDLADKYILIYGQFTADGESRLPLHRQCDMSSSVVTEMVAELNIAELTDD